MTRPSGADTAPRPAPVLAIGASTGGPTAVAAILGALSPNFPAAVLVVQHLDPTFSDNLAAWLGGKTALPVAVAKAGDRPRPGHVLLARGGDHLVLNAAGFLAYCREPASAVHRPSVDVFFESLAARSEPGVAVLLTGMGSDGARGLLAMKEAGWFTIAQDQESSAVYGMPKAAKDLGAARLVLPLGSIAALAAKHLLSVS